MGLDLPCVTLASWERFVLGKIDIAMRCAWREAKKRSESLRIEAAAEAWAYRQVDGTRRALQIRSACECFGASLWHAGVDVHMPEICFEHEKQEFEGLLTNCTAAARADESDEDWWGDGSADTEFTFIDEEGISAKAQRHSANGAPRREWTGKVWVAGSKIKVKAPVHPRQQKQANVKGARQRGAEARHLRALKKSRQEACMNVDKDIAPYWG